MKGVVVVTGASGYIGSWLVMKLLRQGYSVRATVRDPSNEKKIKPLLDLQGSGERLTIWKADLEEEGSFGEAVKGCEGVFHVATPMNFDSKDPENEVIKPAVSGMLSVMRSSKEAGTVRRVVFTSSAGAVNAQEQKPAEYDESSWSDLEFCRRTKMTGWMYFVSKTLAEKAAAEFAEKHGVHFISIVPTLVVGPFVTTSLPPSMITALALITGNEAHYSILKQVQFVHLDDLCDALAFLYEHPGAEGRFICSSHDLTIHELAKMFRERFPQYSIPQKFKGIDEKIGKVHFSSKKLLDLGYKFKYSVEDMFDSAIRVCLEKQLLPLQTVEQQCSSSRAVWYSEEEDD